VKIDEVLSQPFPENVQKVVDWLEAQPKDEVFLVSTVAENTNTSAGLIERSSHLSGWCVEFPLGCEWYGGKAALKVFRRKHKKQFGKGKLEN